VRMAEIFRKHLAHLEGWIVRQDHLDVLQVSYNDVLSDPEKRARGAHLGGGDHRSSFFQAKSYL